jgi:hypothetical protein
MSTAYKALHGLFTTSVFVACARLAPPCSATQDQDQDRQSHRGDPDTGVSSASPITHTHGPHDMAYQSWSHRLTVSDDMGDQSWSHNLTDSADRPDPS